MAAAINGQWGYSVPLDDANGNPRATTSRSNSNEVRSLSRQSSAWDLQSDSETTRTRKTTARAANASATRKRSRNQLRDTAKRDRSEKREAPVDDSAWIHRDKLAQIEIREMEEAGIPVHPSQRAASRSASRSDVREAPTQERQYDEVYDDDESAAGHSGHTELARKRVSTIPAADEQEAYEEALYAESRPLDEPLPEPPSSSSGSAGGRHHAARPSTSRIPVSAKGGVPIPTEAITRESPRSRAGSNAHMSNWDDLNYANRGRAGSMSSQVLPDDAGSQGVRTTPPGSAAHPSTAFDSSPPKARTPQKTTPGPRKTSGAATRPGSSQGNRNRQTSASAAAAKRPGSSQGHRAQPSTGYTWNPPEGDAPWINNMYKPDPRLPPDQQILPTHMKRMMQEQWEREGKTGSAYDRQFGLLNNDEFAKPRSPVKSVAQNPMDLELDAFPKPAEPAETRSPASPIANAGSPTSLHDMKSDSSSTRPGTSGGYRITPTIPATPNLHRSPITSPPRITSPIPGAEPIPPRMPVMDEKDEAEAKKGCCCVVM